MPDEASTTDRATLDHVTCCKRSIGECGCAHRFRGQPGGCGWDYRERATSRTATRHGHGEFQGPGPSVAERRTPPRRCASATRLVSRRSAQEPRGGPDDLL